MGKSMIAAIAVYALWSIVTFGHAASKSQADQDAEYAKCEGNPKRTYCFEDSVTPPLSGFLGGILWPLYWSWEAFSHD